MGICVSDYWHPSYVSYISKPESQFSSGKGFNECKHYSALCYIQDIVFTSLDIQPGRHFSPSTRVSCDAEGTFSKLGKDPKWGAHWSLMFWAVSTLQTNFRLQNRLKVGLISIHFGCLKVMHPGQAPTTTTTSGLFLQPTARQFHLSWMLIPWQDESLKPTKPAFILLKLWEVNPLIINS